MLACPLQVVAPRRAALAEANKRLDGANKKLSNIRARVKELQDRVAALEENLMRATEDKNAAVAAVRKVASSLSSSFIQLTGNCAHSPTQASCPALPTVSLSLLWSPSSPLLCPAG